MLSVTLLLFSLLGATNAVYSALLFVSDGGRDGDALGPPCSNSVIMMSGRSQMFFKEKLSGWFVSEIA